MSIVWLLSVLFICGLFSANDCSRICFSCIDKSENETCDKVVKCEENEVCYVQKYKGADNRTRYDVGCSYPELCRKNSLGVIFGRRSADHYHVLCHRCCTDNVCNDAFSCNNDFKAPLLQCLSCGGVSSVDNCNRTAVCGHEEVCFIQKYRTMKNETHVDLGCKASTMCMNGLTSDNNGRRSEEERHLLCETCCGGTSLCNRNLDCSHHLQTSINTSCNSTSSCQSNLICHFGKCQCPNTDYFWSINTCHLLKQGNHNCSSSYECRQPLRCFENMCTCQKERFWNGSTCLQKKTFHNTCKLSTECLETLFCIHGVCKCDRLDYWTGHNCSARKTIKSTCAKTEECKDSLHCFNGMCSCLGSNTGLWDGQICRPKRTIGEPCSRNDDCKSNLYCNSSKCFCDVFWDGDICSGPTECADLQFFTDDVYVIYTNQTTPKAVYCIIESGLKWTVIQRRLNFSENFKRNWQEYKNGFGDVHGEYWLGNDIIHMISQNGRHKIRIKLEKHTGEKFLADYSTFRVRDETSKYLLNITGYTGTAGDSMDNIKGGKSNGYPFSTYDGGSSCATGQGGGWWHSDCGWSDLNSDVNNRFKWYFDLGETSMIKSVMMITKY
ncbi:uncharacterized protein LOC134690494 [Mytilus trossulus]|uniref:uncharacterized protein LOC134690494 n=1 Tax=Mytilus trossulus TaxID=6551 RepID=UPI003005525E